MNNICYHEDDSHGLERARTVFSNEVSDCMPRRRPLGATRGAPGKDLRAAGHAICCAECAARYRPNIARSVHDTTSTSRYSSDESATR